MYKLDVQNFELNSIHGMPEMADNCTVCEKEYFHRI